MHKLLTDIKNYVDKRGAVWQSDIIKEFSLTESPEEYKKVYTAMIHLIHSGDIVCTNLEPQSLLSSSQRHLH